MTFILNILHRDMSILAADRKAIAGELEAAAHAMSASAEVRDFNKITLNSSICLAVGISGNTHEHYYLPEISLSASVNDVLSKIRKNMEYVLRVNKRSGLKSLSPFMVNQCIATFFDKDADMYCTNTFLFSPVQNQTRLHSGGEVAKIFYAGSGSKYFEEAVGMECIESFLSSTKNSCTPAECVPWMQDAYERVSARDNYSGSGAMFVVSTRSNPRFSEWNAAINSLQARRP
ncbi:hypothetical protein NLU14_10685 [Marinobacter sp. 71-i]|uniref:Uncharacterized protein n=1 Tax=Marinobacter iranensis TaxID=2962607 RepID=A0ABT5YAJ8_9GAMM|nr:hypothetical protein [Marinobacter iranensis]MDF0750695.1 hypothetical protein [Marinobacter iranensis]